MKKPGKTVAQRRLDAAKKRLAVVEGEAVQLRADVESMQKERSLQLYLRAIHTDVDSIKHMVRALTVRTFVPQEASTRDEMEELVGDRCNNIVEEVLAKGRFAGDK